MNYVHKNKYQIWSLSKKYYVIIISLQKQIIVINMYFFFEGGEGLLLISIIEINRYIICVCLALFHICITNIYLRLRHADSIYYNCQHQNSSVEIHIYVYFICTCTISNNIYVYVVIIFFGNPSKLIKLVYEIIINIICKNYYHLFNTVSIQ